MTFVVRKAGDRFHTRIDWLDSWHTFSFGEHFDPKHMGFRALRVINDDRVAAGGGFPTHGHRDMEIVSYVVEGALAHQDSTGGGSTIRPGDVQRMTAGRGVHHSEHNAAQGTTRFLQIWIEPATRGLTPSYEEKRFSDAERRGKLRAIAAPGGKDGATTLHQDATIFASLLEAGERVEHALAAGRGAWLQIVRGQALVDGKLEIAEGDGVAIVAEPRITIEGRSTAELLLFDLA